MVKPLTFKGDKPKKRKRPAGDEGAPATAPDKPQPANDDLAAEDDSWVSADVVSDMGGPTVLLLATTPTACLATDANGKIFASRIETLAEEAPYTTAEPHDVRQVWVANRVAGTETFSFKGHHGRYLACDAVGVVSAAREAVGPEEGWTVVPVPAHGGAFALRTARDKFVGVGEAADGADLAKVVVRGDAGEIGAGSTVRIRMQARFKPRVQQSKEDRASAKISRRELEEAVGRRLDDDEVRRLKRARRDGSYHEALLDVKVKGKHDKFA